MAPSFAHMPPYARAAFIAAQLDALAGPDEPFEAPTEALIEQQAEVPTEQHVKAPPATEPAPKKRIKKRKLAASARAKAILRAAKIPKRRADTDDSESTFDHHRRKCQVCNHPDREAIEELFIAWHSPRSIRVEFGTYHRLDCSSIYRHARAAGLYAKRRKNLRAVFDLILEHAGNIEPTAHGIVAIVRAYSCLTDTHDWIEPERRVHVVNHVYRHDVPASAVAACPDDARAVAAPPALVGAARVSGGRSFSSDTEPVENGPSFRASHPRDVVASDSAPPDSQPAPSQAFLGANGFHRPAPSETADNSSSDAVPPTETAPPSGGRSFSSDTKMVNKGSSFRALHTRDVVGSDSLPASLPPSLSASGALHPPSLATSHSPLATRISNRHTPEIRIASNSHKTNNRPISNRHISHPVSTQSAKEKSPKTTVASRKDKKDKMDG